MSCNTYCIYHTCTHCYILCYTVQCIYTHALIYSDTTTLHDLLLLHHDIHIIPVYTSPSAMPYIIIYNKYNKIQKQDRQQTIIQQKDIKRKRSGIFQPPLYHSPSIKLTAFSARLLADTINLLSFFKTCNQFCIYAVEFLKV